MHIYSFLVLFWVCTNLVPQPSLKWAWDDNGVKKLVLVQNICEVELALGVSGHTLLVPGWTVSVSETLQCAAPKSEEPER